MASTPIGQLSERQQSSSAFLGAIQDRGSVAVIIPAYNEADTVEECLLSVLNSTDGESAASSGLAPLEVWLVDDESTDRTWAIAQALQHRLGDRRLKLLPGQPRPDGESWMGKNWACAQAADQITADFLLFIDADVRLQPGAIETATTYAQAEQVDLLSCGPGIVCQCLAEWLVQPLMFSAITLGFNYEAVNDPHSKTAFATGPFMLFRRTAYEQVGGHRAVAAQVVEDVELARLVKGSGLTLRFLVGSGLVAVRMYRSWAALWEGWTKNVYLSSQRNLVGTLMFAATTLWACTVPWVGMMGLLLKAIWLPLRLSEMAAIALFLVAIGLQYDLRCVEEKLSQIPPRYWWLTWLGGLAVAAIAVGSIIKTETGWGWTWRGRKLKASDRDERQLPKTTK